MICLRHATEFVAADHVSVITKSLLSVPPSAATCIIRSNACLSRIEPRGYGVMYRPTEAKHKR
jgi:hypothetical protein